MKIQDLDSFAAVIGPIAQRIEMLSQRIAQNRPAVSASETATRNQLIEPLLRVLGWDISDPELVTPEYTTGGGKADYALMQHGVPVALIEAKRLGVKLAADSLLQAFGYVNDESIRFVIISNGDDWEMHSLPLSQKALVASFNVGINRPYPAAIQAAKLSRDIITATIGIEAVEPSVLPITPAHSMPEPKAKNSVGGDSVPGWLPIQNRSWTATHKKPTAVMINGVVHDEVPDRKDPSKKKKLGEWADFTQLIGTWLVKEKKLKSEQCPVSVTTKKRCLVNTVPAHPDGKPFFEHSRRRLPLNMWIETNQGAEQHVDYAARLFEKCGVNPDLVQVQIE